MNILFFLVYAPHSDKSDEKKFLQLGISDSNMLLDEMVVSGGDMNGRVGRINTKYAGAHGGYVKSTILEFIDSLGLAEHFIKHDPRLNK